MNQVVLSGRLTKDPANGFTDEVVKFNVAVPRKYKKGDYTADFINCTAFGKTGEIVRQYFHKGSRIALTGRIQTGHYENREGKTVYTWDVIAESVEFVDTKAESSQESQQEDDWQQADVSDLFQ